MKKLFKIFVAVLLLSGIAADASAQKKAAKRSTQKKAAKKEEPAPPPPPVVVAPKKDSVPPAPLELLKLPEVPKSLRNDGIVEKQLIKDRTPLAYENIREDDAIYRQRIWREIDVHEKMNQPFVYDADEDNGNQMLINILLKGIKDSVITAFSAENDRFTKPMTLPEIGELLVDKPQTIKVVDWANDPTGQTMKDSTIVNEFNPRSVEKFRIKEEWVFDKESSRLFVRIIGIAPLRNIYNEDGSLRAVTPAFWIYYPDCREYLAKFEAYNGKNWGQRMSWEDLFEKRFFSSYIIKSTMDNPNNLTLREIYKDPNAKDNILMLLEGDNIRNKIFDYEQNLWSY
ncbi:MAG: gliding motility protein GldN [Bacteroidota bacterium]